MMLPVIPHHISCSLFIRAVLNNGKVDDAWGEEVSFETQRKLLLISLKVIRNTDISWQEFQEYIKPVVTDDIYLTVVKEMHQTKNVDLLMDSFQSLDALFDPHEPTLKRSSVLGLFIRKVLLDFKKMTFENISLLSLSVQKYLDSGSDHKDGLAKNSFEFTPQQDDNSMDTSKMEESTFDASTMEESVLEEEKENIATPSVSPLPTFVSKSESNIFVSRNKVVRFISEQARFLECNDRVALNPSELQTKIDEINIRYPDIYEVCYLSFLNYLRVSEINRATVMLQRFFDYKVFNEEKSESDITVLEKHQMKFKRFRYCALNLGIMHCYHNNYSEALISLEEAIRIAQETNDQKCLNHAMFWLSLVKEETTTPQDGEDHLKQFIAETAKDILKPEESNSSTQIIDYLGVLRLIKLQTLKGAQSPSKLLSTVSQLVISNPMIANTGQLLRSEMLNFYGFSTIASMMCQTSLQQMKPPSVNTFQNPFSLSEDDLVVSLCQLASHFENEGYYDEAMLILSFALGKISLYSVHRKKVQLCETRFRFRQHIALRNIDKAFSLVNSIKSVDKHEGKYAAAVVDVVSGNLLKASKSLQEFLILFKSPSNLETVNPVLKVQLLLLLVEVHLLSSKPLQAIQKILEVITFTESRYMSGLRIDASICLVRYLMQSHFIEKAHSIVDELILHSLTNGNRMQQGMLFYLEAKCHIEKGKNLQNEKKKVNLLKVSSLLDKSLQSFQNGYFNARLKDVYFEQAIVFHQLEYFQERNKASTQYRLLHEKFKNYPNVMLF